MGWSLKKKWRNDDWIRISVAPRPLSTIFVLESFQTRFYLAYLNFVLEQE